MGAILTKATLPGSLAQVGHVTPVSPATATGLVRRVYGQLEQDFGMLAPPVILHSPAPRSLAACWTMLRESLLAAGAVPRSLREVVAAAVSAANRCPYCADVHGATLRGLTRGRYAAEIAADRIGDIRDPEVREIAQWARGLGRRSTAVRLPRRTPEENAELVAVAVTFHYLNRMVNVFLGESPLPPDVPARARPGLMRLFGLVMSTTARRAARPGLSLDLLPAAPLPAELSWAAGAPHLTGAFAQAAAAVEEAGRRAVPEPVRELVSAALAEWDGEPAGPSRAWAEDRVRALPEECRPAGRLALLTALASYQVDHQVIAGFRRTDPGDRALVELTSWASLAAARTAGAWIAGPEPVLHTTRNGRTVP
ncbi:carboxymuconolactone decarboxylase family protein [Microbispora sp. ZYX-F-249]|uniref:Carboxymuconolactone decarboxylase family protein n=1 Tax=Microbispora maris TaxID=3144104 RepID=A0ABV0AXF1_9ACTN